MFWSLASGFWLRVCPSQPLLGSFAWSGWPAYQSWDGPDNGIFGQRLARLFRVDGGQGGVAGYELHTRAMAMLRRCVVVVDLGLVRSITA